MEAIRVPLSNACLRAVVTSGAAWKLVLRVPGHDDRVGLGKGWQPCCDADREPGAGYDAARRGTAHGQFVRGARTLGEDLGGDTQVEGEHAGQCQNSDTVRFHG